MVRGRQLILGLVAGAAALALLVSGASAVITPTTDATALATAMHASQPDAGALGVNKFAIAEDNPHVFT